VINNGIAGKWSIMLYGSNREWQRMAEEAQLVWRCYGWCVVLEQRMRMLLIRIKKSLFQVKLIISNNFFPAGTQGIEIFSEEVLRDFFIF